MLFCSPPPVSFVKWKNWVSICLHHIIPVTFNCVQLESFIFADSSAGSDSQATNERHTVDWLLLIFLFPDLLFWPCNSQTRYSWSHFPWTTNNALSQIQHFRVNESVEKARNQVICRRKWSRSIVIAICYTFIAAIGSIAMVFTCLSFFPLSILPFFRSFPVCNPEIFFNYKKKSKDSI